MNKETKWIAKIMPDQFDYDIDKFNNLKKEADLIVYLYRENFEAQCKSWIAANKKQMWDYKFKPNYKKQFNLSVDHTYCNKWIDILVNNYDFIKQIYKTNKGPVHTLESFENTQPYPVSYNWNMEPRIPTYNVKNIFKEI